MFKPKANILITGASGFIGRALIKRLAKTKARLFLVSREKTFKISGATHYYGDLTNFNFCRKILKKINTVYYLAAEKKNIAEHIARPFSYFVNNSLPLFVFLKALKKSSVTNLIYLSSVNAVYVNQELSQGILDGYGLGKFCGELALKTYGRENPKVFIKIIRPTMAYGPGLNYSHAQATANFLPAVIDRVYHSQKEVIIWGRGERRLQFIYLDDLIINIIAAGRLNRAVELNFGHPEALSINSIVRKVIMNFNKPLAMTHDLSKPDKPTQLLKFNNLIKPRVNFSIGLKKTIQDYLSRHP